MKKQTQRLLTVLLCASLLIAILSGCSLFEKKDKVIAVDRVESDGQTITVIYKDGFEFELNFYSVLTYDIGTPYFVSGSNADKKEEPTGEVATWENAKLTAKTSSEVSEDATDKKPVTITGGKVEFSTDSESGRVSITLGGSSSVNLGLGVRVMGTNDNPLGVEAMMSSIHLDSISGSSQAGQSISIQITDSGKTEGLDLAGNGKKYEFYGPYLRDCVIAHLKEVTVLDSLSDVQGGTLAVDCILSGGFAELVNLEKVVLPDGIKTIYSGAFYRCTSLKTIQYEGTVEQWKSIKKSADWDQESGNYTVYCTDGTVAKGE